MVGFSGNGVVELIVLSTACLQDAKRRMLLADILFAELAEGMSMCGWRIDWRKVPLGYLLTDLGAAQLEMIDLVEIDQRRTLRGAVWYMKVMEISNRRLLCLCSYDCLVKRKGGCVIASLFAKRDRG